MSGFSDEFYAATSKFFRDGRISESKKDYYSVGQDQDVRGISWFELSDVVWEMKVRIHIYF